MSGNALVPVPMATFVSEVAQQLNASQLLGAGIGGAMVAPAGVDGAGSGTLAAWRAESVCVTQFGAKGDAVVGVQGVIVSNGSDDTAAFMLAFAWLAEKPGRALNMPAGCYNLASLTTSLVMPNGATLHGAGMHRSRIIWNDQAGFDLFVTAGTASVPVQDIAFSDFTVTGSCATNWVATTGGYPFLLNNAAGVAMRRVCSEWSRAMGIALRHCDDVIIEQPLVRYSALDGISVTACEHVSISGAVVEWTDDDAISWHSDTTELAPHGTLVLTGFRIRFAGGGINALGAKLCVISGGVLELVRFQGISVGGAAGATEGYTSLFGVAISDVIIRDMLDASLSGDGASGCRGVCINSAPGQAGGAGATPGTNNAAASVVIPLIGNVDGNSAGDATAIAIGAGVAVSHVMVLCGRSAVANYSAYGFGPLFTRHGWIDPAVPKTAMQPGAVDCLGGIIRDMRFVNCLFEGNGGAQAIYCGGGVRLIAAEMIGCTFRDFAAAIFVGNGITQDLVFRGGVIDLDPYLTMAGRATVGGRLDGSWQNTASAPVVVQNGAGLLFENVTMRNMAAVTVDSVMVGFMQCVLRCLPAAVGYSAANKGVGTVPAGGEQFLLIAEDADPESATFGQILFAPSLDNAVQPTSGHWVTGQFVRNNVPVATQGQVLMGWVRLTTGSGQTAGVDWAASYASLS